LLLKLAENLCTSLVASGEWTGAKKGRTSAFTSDKSSSSNNQSNSTTKYKPVCWNYGKEGHTLQQCTVAHDKNCIAVNRVKFRAKQKSNSSPTQVPTVTTPPTNGKLCPAEESEKSRCVIDGKHMY
jgi:hypothetical protein